MNTTRVIVMASVLAGLAAGDALAGRPGEPKTFSLGLALGAPTGIALKYWVNHKNAIAGAIGGFGYRGLVLHGDYLWHRHDVFKSAKPRTTAFYFGPGAFMASGGRVIGGPVVVGVRGVIGLSYAFPRDPFDLFIELAPNVVFGGGVWGGLQGALGGRYCF